MKKDSIQINMPIRDIDKECDLECMAEPDGDGVLRVLVVECE